MYQRGKYFGGTGLRIDSQIRLCNNEAIVELPNCPVMAQTSILAVNLKLIQMMSQTKGLKETQGVGVTFEHFGVIG